MMKCFFSIAGLFFLAAGVFAQPIKRPIPRELAERLRVRYNFSAADTESLKTAGEIIRFQDEDFSSLILRDSRLAATLTDMKALEATILVEALFVVPMEKGLPGREDFRLKVYNVLHKIDTMKGLQYFSESSQKMQTMFNDAYIIANPESRTPLPNPVALSIPNRDKIFVYQDDSRFGKNIYEASYYYSNGSFRVSMKNLTKLYYGIVPLVQPEKLRLDMIILPGDDYLIFYGCIGADTFTFFGLQKRALPSFSNRIKALFSWFLQNL